MKETNMEHYRKEIEEILNNKNPFTINKKGEISHCRAGAFNCNECLFNGQYCITERMRWLMAEYEPPKPKLTKRERELCEFFQTGWIARDLNGFAYWFEKFPIKINLSWTTEPSEHFNMFCVPYHDILFQFIKWEDDEPWAVEDLLKLEVVE